MINYKDLYLRNYQTVRMYALFIHPIKFQISNNYSKANANQWVTKNPPGLGKRAALAHNFEKCTFSKYKI